MALTDSEKKITGAVENLSKCVVVIRSSKMVQAMPFGGQMPQQGSGTGFIIDSNGNILTNFHVIAGAEKVDVTLNDGRVLPGTVVGGDRATDIALVKIESTNLNVAKLGDSEKLKVGQSVLAIGNALDLQGGPTVSVGVVSALGRPIFFADYIAEGLIQTDAAINPGNSGGPLADLDGNVVGINTAIVPYAQGVGFAIPINAVKLVVEQIFEKGRVVRPMMGITAVTLTPVLQRRFDIALKEGVLVAGVAHNSPAKKAGIRELDVIVRIDGVDIKATRDLTLTLAKHSIGDTVTVEFQRRGERLSERVKLVEAPTQ